MQIPLSKNQYAIVDDEDAALIAPHSWWVSNAGNRGSYAYARIDGKNVAMHRIIMGVDGPLIDHINRNGLDNRRCNLRHCTASQNCANRIVPVSKFGFRGVSVRGDGYVRPAPYRAEISFQGKRIRGRSFESAAMAAREYDRLAKEYYGEFAVLNFPAEDQ